MEAKLKYHCVVHEDRCQFVRVGKGVGICLDCYKELGKIGCDGFAQKYGVNVFDKISESKPVVCTIGYQGKKLDMLIEMLKCEYVDYLVDVRSKPYSQYAAEFNKKNLQAAVEQRGIKYLWLGDVLGGLEGVNYPLWRERLPQVVNLAKVHRPVIMCMERNYTSCHRQQLAEILRDEFGCDIKHL